MHSPKRPLLLALFVVVLSACSVIPPPATTAPSPAPTATTAASPTQGAGQTTPGGTARALAETGVMDDLDPSTACMGEFKVFVNVYDTLTRYNLPGSAEQIGPGLATSWTHSDDGRTWTFKLRQGVKFHDGSEVNAAAVKYSVERTKKAGVCSAYMLDPIQAIDTPDPYTVVFHLDRPVSLDAIMASPYQSWIMSPTAIGDHPHDWFAQGHDAGSGPYRIAQFEPAQRLVLQRFDDYWGGWQPNQIDTVIFEVVMDNAVAEQMVAAGQTDFATSVALQPEQMTSLAANGDYLLDASPSYLNYFIFLNHRRAPTDDARVRQALAYSFPYDEVQAQFTLGKSTRAHGAVPANVWGHMPEVWPYNYDPGKAKSLLEEAGYGEGMELTIGYWPGGDMIPLLWQAALAKIGVKLNLETTDFDTLWEKGKSDPEHAPQATVAVGFPDVIDPYSYLHLYFHSEEQPQFNMGYYRNPEFDALIDAAHLQGVTDQAGATEKYIRAQDMLTEDAAAIFALDLVAFHLIRSDLTGYANNPAYSEAVFWHDLRRTPAAE